jgi:7,8-dihydropterin-6-yl-methyl-4-(beta-D-ribofuranosyl)aminobenzene 5'-phosphate synthase
LASIRETLTTTFGVAYLIKTDTATILYDVGNNPDTRDPSPLMFNMQQLGIKLSDISIIAISHAHFDHTGGPQWQFNNTFSLGNRQVDLGSKRIYVPQPLTYPGTTPIVTTQPMTIAQGVATIGNLAMTSPGVGDEQVLVINVEGKGIVLITGCGHPTVQKIVERAQAVFDEPIFGIVGGLHLTSKDPKVFQPSVDNLKGLKLGLIALSPHDASGEVIQALREVYPGISQDIKVGQAITVGQ